MKKQLLVLILAGMSLTLAAQETNNADQAAAASGEKAPSNQDKTVRKKHGKENRVELKKRQLRLMERALNQIGVTEEQRQQIMALQDVHMEKMKSNWKRMNEARRELSRLQDAGASLEELKAAITEVSNAQAEQLEILVLNRKEMEKILGKEKNDLLMEKAHEYFRQHGRRPGTGVPPRPGGPPVPGQGEKGNSEPPLPINPAESAPPTPQ